VIKEASEAASMSSGSGDEEEDRRRELQGRGLRSQQEAIRNNMYNGQFQGKEGALEGYKAHRWQRNSSVVGWC
jgi:hypothetical protein